MKEKSEAIRAKIMYEPPPSDYTEMIIQCAKAIKNFILIDPMDRRWAFIDLPTSGLGIEPTAIPSPCGKECRMYQNGYVIMNLFLIEDDSETMTIWIYQCPNCETIYWLSSDFALEREDE